MSNKFVPKGRSSLPTELINFGRHLVYTEGTKTEPFYIESIKKEISNKYNCNPNHISIITAGDGTSYNTISLVNFAKKDIENRLRKKEIIDHVWIFFDKDEFPISDFNNADKMINEMNNSEKENNDGFKYNKNTEISWHSCFSNEAFELWLCLYFNLYNSALSRDNYIRILDQNLSKNGPYSKTLKNIHQLLTKSGGNINNAIKYAKKLFNNNKLSNPSTSIYLFAEYFKPYMK